MASVNPIQLINQSIVRLIYFILVDRLIILKWAENVPEASDESQKQNKKEIVYFLVIGVFNKLHLQAKFRIKNFGSK